MSILTNYYQDLSKGQVDATQYYAPQIERFFNSKNLSSEQINQSLQNSIAQSPGRKLRLIPEQLQTGKTADGYYAELAGIASKTDDTGALISRDTFRNRIGFNQEMKIISYESIANPVAQTRKLGVRYADKESLVSDLLKGFKTGKLEALSETVHPDLGAYFLYRNGAFPATERIEQPADINSILSNQFALMEIRTDFSQGAIPDFDCEKGFARRGCFLEEVTGEFTELSATLEYANQAQKRSDASQTQQVKQIEQLVSWQVVETNTGICFYLGQDNDRWYVLMIDIAQYNCSA
ncbi:MAG: hypothetical protein AAFQ87_08300 [Bacteroidota bacterium]